MILSYLLKYVATRKNLKDIVQIKRLSLANLRKLKSPNFIFSGNNTKLFLFKLSTILLGTPITKNSYKNGNKMKLIYPVQAQDALQEEFVLTCMNEKH